ncbi:MAG: energy-coupled thiamine transporter ThiT [Candidatus Bathyarchaeota archaeon]|nr:energy-coupled thiamine transporter ThiT [Candidatus Bathyarchaeota archaeon]
MRKVVTVYAPAGTHPASYSAIFNGGYIILEFIISAVIICVFVKRRLLDIYV